MDDPVEGPPDLPDLLDAERPDLRALAGEAETLESDPGEVPLRPLGQHGHSRHHVGTRLEVAERFAVASASLVAGPHTACATVRDQQLLRRGLGQDHRAALLRLFREPATEP